MPVSPDHPAWLTRLPTRRCWFHGQPVGDEEAHFTLEDYFGAVRSFMDARGLQAAIRALSRPGIRPGAVDEVGIFLSKHGEFYHPSRIVIETGGQRLEMALNVALTDAGKSIIQKEYGILERLNREYTPSYLPEVYAFGDLQLEGKPLISMFLGQWFSGFHEFHLTRRRSDSEPQVAVWEPQSECRLLNRSQTRALYAEIARILTYYFNPASGECIASWHHAAGDFVVRLAESGLQVRLVTVREYRPLFSGGPPGQDIKIRLEALLIFFLHLSLRTRLDRLDGVGDIAWAEPVAVKATLDGLLEALAQKTQADDLLPPIDELFKHYLLSSCEKDLLDICMSIVGKYHPKAPELPILKAHLSRHAADLALAISRM